MERAVQGREANLTLNILLVAAPNDQELLPSLQVIHPLGSAACLPHRQVHTALALQAQPL